MTKFELSFSESNLDVVTCDEVTSKVLQCSQGTHISKLLTSEKEWTKMESAIAKLSDADEPSAFETLELVFKAPGAQEHSPGVDRSKLDGVFRSPMEAIHLCGELEIATFVHLERQKEDGILTITAIEYSRKHRKKLLRQEFGSWVLEEHIEKAVIATTVMGEICFWNRFAGELYGYSADEVMGKSIIEVTPSEMTQEQAVEIMGQLGQGKHWNGEFRVKKRDGNTFLAHVTDTPIMGMTGACEFIVGVSADYSQLYDLMDQLQTLNANLEQEVEKRTQELLASKKAMLLAGAAVQASDTGVIVTDEKRKIIFSNDAVCNLLASDQQRLIGLLPEDLPLLTKSGEWQSFLQQAEAGLEAGRTVLPCKEIDVQALLPVSYMSVTAQALSLEDTMHHMYTLRDVTMRKRAEKAQYAAEKAMALSKTKTEMMQMLSHELRSPLQGIMGTTSTMLSDIPLSQQNTEAYDEISTILASSRLLLTLINTVLDVRKIDENMMPNPILDPLDVFESIENCLSFCSPFASQQNVKLTFDTDVDHHDCSVLGNKLRVEQTVINLITNSIKYGCHGEEVIVSVRNVSANEALAEIENAASSDLKVLPEQEACIAGNEVTIVSIRDHGNGIPESEFGLVFGSFSQLSSAIEMEEEKHEEQSPLFAQSSGSGLGLNLVLKFVVSMGGHVWFDNCQDGPGVKFSFCLPRCESPMRKPSSAPGPNNATMRLQPAVAETLRVLIVDDTNINCKVLSKMLKKLGCKTVWTANSPAQALRMLDANLAATELLPNLIISDLNMPGMDGYEFIREARAMKLPSDPIAFAWSADWDPAIKSRCLESGFDLMIRKPLAIRDLEHILLSHVVDDNIDHWHMKRNVSMENLQSYRQATRSPVKGA
mmetsp:Transcript_3577/g.8156  ORF Transcript_3577/g.8156 Transcript_3577/m.8156 type:complete len:881 (+) Transcript_3577:3-2645(+)